MKASGLHLPATVEEAVTLLAADLDAKCVAGGATLVAMMNANLVEISDLISLRDVAGLKGITCLPDGSVRIGAMTRHHDIATSGAFSPGQMFVSEAASRIGHPAIRNMGTIGGSIAHADPAADFPTVLAAADAFVEIAGRADKRELKAAAFFVDYLSTALQHDEIVTAVRLPPPPPGAVSVYEKFSRVEGDFATVSVALMLAGDGRSCTAARLALGACGPTPVRVEAAEERLLGTGLGPGDIAAACGLLVAACDPVDDMRGSAEYRLSLVPVLVERALARAMERLKAAP
jgi:aerobic carbon-monoxide dehydrogenase medium subunit